MLKLFVCLRHRVLGEDFAAVHRSSRSLLFCTRIEFDARRTDEKNAAMEEDCD